MKRNRRASTLALAGLAMAACQDIPTIVTRTTTPHEAVARRYSAQGVQGAAVVRCAISRRVEGREYPYEYGVLRLHFPANAVAPDGSTRLFRWRVQAPGQEPVVSGSCQIPNTSAAVEFVMKRLGLDQAQRSKQDDGLVSTQGCVIAKTSCPIDGIVVTAPSSSTWGWDWSGAGGDENDDSGFYGSGWGSQGDYYEPGGGGYEPDPGPDSTYRPECTRNANGHCETRAADAEWDALGEKIAKLHAPTAACARAKGILQEAHAAGPGAQRIRVWDGYDVQWDSEDERYEQRYGQNLSDSQGRYIEYDSYWMLNDQELLAHEALHWYLNEQNSPMTGKEAHAWIAQEQVKCATGRI